MEITKEMCAYAAGLFDGEGCVQISTPYNKKNNRRYHRLDVSIGQKDPRPLLWMREHFGGRVQLREYVKNQSVNAWLLNNKAGGEFLALIRPYVIVKAEQIDVALAFRATVAPKLGNKRLLGAWGKTAWQNPAAITDELQAKRDQLRQQLSKLKEVS